MASPPIAHNTWTLTGRMAIPRIGPTATLLGDGRVLVVGGSDAYAVFESSELYDPVTGIWYPTSPMSTLRNLHVSAALSDGRVLVATGYNGAGCLASAELYDVNAGTWTATDSLRTPRSAALGIGLNDGTVLVAGGIGSSQPAIREFFTSAEIYDPNAGAFAPKGMWSATGGMGEPRLGATLTLLTDGRALVAGGFKGNAPGDFLQSAEIYDPGAHTWAPTGNMTTPRSSHTATLLSDGTVLVTGGWSGAATLATAELYDPVTGNWSGVASMSVPRQSSTVALLSDGRVLVVGGDEPSVTAEVYDPPPINRWEPTTSMIGPRRQNTSTLLLNGDVLVAGGAVGNTDLTDGQASAELFHP